METIIKAKTGRKPKNSPDDHTGKVVVLRETTLFAVYVPAEYTGEAAVEEALRRHYHGASVEFDGELGMYNTTKISEKCRLEDIEDQLSCGKLPLEVKS